jgi:hypothetical protein
MRRLLVRCCGFLALMVLTGCGDSTAGRVSGKVTVDGQLAEQGTISFYPEDGKTRTAGGLIKNGLYSVEVPVGTMLVRINVPKIVGKRKLYNAPNSPERPISVETLPPRYNADTQLRFEVTSRNLTKDWELTTK